MTSALPSALQRSASSIAPLTAWLASGAGTMPSARANCDAGLEALELVVGARLDQAEFHAGG